MNLYKWHPCEEYDEVSDTAKGNISLSLGSKCSSSDDLDSWSSASEEDELESLMQMRQRLELLHERLMRYSEQHVSVKGLLKLSRRLKKEIALVEDTIHLISEEKGDVEPQCSLLHDASVHHYELILAALECEPDVVSVCTLMRPIRKKKEEKEEQTEVDIVSCGGLRWLKVRAASSQRLHSGMIECCGRECSCCYCAPVSHLLSLARMRRLPFMQVPQVVVLFRHQPPLAMIENIQRMGARPVSYAEMLAKMGDKSTLQQYWYKSEFLPSLSFNVDFICFDTTALVALCSEACFADAPAENVVALQNYHVMAEQQRREMETPCVRSHIEPALERYTKWYDKDEFIERMRENVMRRGGDASCISHIHTIDLSWLEELIATTSLTYEFESTINESLLVRRVQERCKDRMADNSTSCFPNWIIADITLAEFRWIMETIAGPKELRRALSLLHCCCVATIDRKCLEGNNPLLTNVSLLATRNKVSLRNRLVFGLGDILGAVVFSSNRQIVYAAQDEGVEILVVSHPARALVEQKVYGMQRRDGPTAPPPIDSECC
ncbi:uncharacterized protein TM35_000054380 [Trypanosoma theileri]|uniref:DUF1308 domain-containing protein n=1 Tax=Trypanosoma theileri TaxID=67003 RepID=A0A1X0P4J1_9TRYP|nr:uncharacterized protein TM35_000054380 [Trypanosoma theileri]ORC91842.1 hypothetical protein TM35_000054380 [Trypanosoma theileri]